MKLYLLPVITAIVLGCVVADPYKVLNLKTSDPQFTLSYAPDNSSASAPNLLVKITLSNYDTKSWLPNVNTGVWVGVGYGQIEMDYSDISLCTFKYTGVATTDVFTCADMSVGAAAGAPVKTSDTQDISNVVTTFSINPTTKLADFTVSF
jgi:hypothetical protein